MIGVQKRGWAKDNDLAVGTTSLELLEVCGVLFCSFEILGLAVL
jgi:hypothetical protein